ncbi:MAG: hypothetical protein HYV28_07100 [Ignavibacteriales bacterium]|nr:hypothetical protein [Ignavibacteriales bacterium]
MLSLSPFPFIKFFIACCFSCTLFAQSAPVTVLCVNGTASQTSISAHVTIPLKAGQKIPAKATITVGKASYVALISTNGGLIELNKEGTYPVNSLFKKKKPATKNLLQKYITLVTKELMKKGRSKDPETETGSDNSHYPSTIYIDFPGDSYILDSTVQFAWYSNKRCFNYTVKLFDEDDLPLFKESTIDTFITVNLIKAGLGNEKPARLYISSSTDANIVSEVVYLIQYNNLKGESIGKELRALLSEANEESPIHCAAISLYLESKKLIAKAYHYLLKAAALLPGDKSIQNIVFDFRERHFIVTPSN